MPQREPVAGAEAPGDTMQVTTVRGGRDAPLADMVLEVWCF